MGKHIENNVFAFVALVVLMSPFLFLGYCVMTYQDEYQREGRKYECFVDGESVWQSNDAPRHLGGPPGDRWVQYPSGEKANVDECFCNGCIGL